MPIDSRFFSMFKLATKVTCSVVAGVGISEYVLTDERLAPLYSKASRLVDSVQDKAAKYGFSFVAHASGFSTPDHGLHPPVYPFEFKKWWATYDHAAYGNLT